jgi:hypothetical protein
LPYNFFINCWETFLRLYHHLGGSARRLLWKSRYISLSLDRRCLNAVNWSRHLNLALSPLSTVTHTHTFYRWEFLSIKTN